MYHVKVNGCATYMKSCDYSDSRINQKMHFYFFRNVFNNLADERNDDFIFCIKRKHSDLNRKVTKFLQI